MPETGCQAAEQAVFLLQNNGIEHQARPPSIRDQHMATQNIWLHQQLKVSCEYLEYLFSDSRFFILLRSEKLQSRPVSRVLSWTVIHLGRPSPDASSDLPEPSAGRTDGFLFGLAPGGVCRATPVTSRAVRSYRTVSPLPAGRGRHRRFAFCCTFRGLAPPRRYLAPCPVEPGLSSPCLRTERLPGRLCRRSISAPVTRAAQGERLAVKSVTRKSRDFHRAIDGIAEWHARQQ